MRYSRTKMMRQIQTLAFNVHEAVLYLDGHPRCQKALEFYKKYNDMLHEAVCAYEENYGPLTQYGGTDSNTWTWIKGPWPWEYEANFCERS